MNQAEFSSLSELEAAYQKNPDRLRPQDREMASGRLINWVNFVLTDTQTSRIASMSVALSVMTPMWLSPKRAIRWTRKVEQKIERDEATIQAYEREQIRRRLLR